MAASVKALFLIAALALPSHLKENWNLLVDFVKAHKPGYEFTLVDLDYSGPVKGWEWTPLTFDGNAIYLRRIKEAS